MCLYNNIYAAAKRNIGIIIVCYDIMYIHCAFYFIGCNLEDSVFLAPARVRHPLGSHNNIITHECARSTTRIRSDDFFCRDADGKHHMLLLLLYLLSLLFFFFFNEVFSYFRADNRGLRVRFGKPGEGKFNYARRGVVRRGNSFLVI